MMTKFDINVIFGYSELKQFHRFENGKRVCYGYRIDYNRDGVEIKRTEPQFVSAVGWSDGSPFTEADVRGSS
jgi:hypothetical protein